jgi:hypothetical protein
MRQEVRLMIKWNKQQEILIKKKITHNRDYQI